MLSGDQLREALEALHQPQLPAELGAEEEEEEKEGMERRGRGVREK